MFPKRFAFEKRQHNGRERLRKHDRTTERVAAWRAYVARRPNRGHHRTKEFTLVAALEAVGLADALSGDGPFTVFAPNNAAFEDYLGEMGMTVEDALADTTFLSTLLQAMSSKLPMTRRWSPA